MQYRALGKAGIKVSPYCLGAMMFGGPGNPDHDDCIRIIHRALDFGIDFIDTADRYSRGESEEIVGKALKGRRDNIVLATKVNGAVGEDPNQQGNSRRWIMKAVDASLRRLQTDHIEGVPQRPPLLRKLTPDARDDAIKSKSDQRRACFAHTRANLI